MKRFLLIVFAVTLGASAMEAQSTSIARQCVQGVWRITAFTHHPEPTNARPQPSLYLFSGRHYAMLRVTATAPRVAPLDPDRASGPELLAVWGNNGFIANAGIYDVDGDRLTIHPVVAKNPNVMTNDFWIAYAMKCEGDLLMLTEIRDNTKATPFPTTFTLSRVE